MGVIGSYTNITVPDGDEEIVISDTNDTLATKNVTTGTMISDRHLSKSVAGGVDVALTAAEALYGQITLTGTITADINVTVPDATNKLYSVTNSTTGSFTVTFKTLTGTGIVIAQGSSSIFVADGTNVEDTCVIPVGTPMVFYQASAPTGWAEVTTQADSALRVVTVAGATGGSVGGASNLSSGCTTVAAHTHGTEYPGTHTHTISNGSNTSPGSYAIFATVASGTMTSSASGSHTHTTNSQTNSGTWIPKYADVIVCKRS